MPEFEWFTAAIERWGFPVVACIALALFIWRVCKWFAAKVATPLVESHQQLVTSITADMKDQTKVMQGLQTTQAAMAVVQAQHSEMLGLLVRGCPLLDEHARRRTISGV